jgi:hypothetical protein
MSYSERRQTMGTRISNRWLAIPGVALALIVCVALVKLSGGAPSRSQPSAPLSVGSKSVETVATTPSDVAPAATTPVRATQADEPTRTVGPSRSDPVTAQPAVHEQPVDRSPSSRVGEDPTLAGIPLAPMGERPSRSAFEDKPGYVPPNDPETNAAMVGRREAPLIDREFVGGASSAEELALQILDALRAKDKKALNALRITSDEFGEILWPEFPASRPITRLKAGDAWFFLDADCVKGANAGMDALGGTNLIFDSISYEVGKAPYRNFTLYDGVRILAHTAEGHRVDVTFARTFAQRNGTWKVYAFKE